jgi:hypothetical protein
MLDAPRPLIDLEAITSRAIKRVWERRLREGQIDEATFKAESDFLLGALTKNMGDPDRLIYSDTKLDTVQAMRRNVFTFVAFKGHNRITDLVNQLTDEKGNLRSRSAFFAEAQKLTPDYNKNWLQAEFDTVVASGQTAAQWHDFQKSKDSLPFLLYKTQADSRVRDAHSVLHDVCKPIDDEFWDEFYPPNGWRCRCYVLQVAKQEGKEDPESYPSTDEVKTIFRNNPGKSGVIFSDEHPYFTNMTYKQAKHVLYNMRQILVKEDVYDKVYQSPTTNGTVDVHLTHGGHEREGNIKVASFLVDQDVSWSGRLRAVSNAHKNVDYELRDGTLIEFKSINGKNSITNALQEAVTKDRNLRHVVFEANVWDRARVKEQLAHALSSRKQIKTVWIIKGEDLYRIDRATKPGPRQIT